MKIHEADAKSLLVAQGLPVPEWEVARTPTQARAAAVRFLGDRSNATGKVVIKAQVLVGGRGKAVIANYDSRKEARLVPIDGSPSSVLFHGELAFAGYQRLAP